MSTDSIRATSISAFPVSHEEPVFVLTGSQLRQIIAEATAPLEARIQDLEDRLNREPVAQNQPQKPVQVVEDLEGKIEALERELEHNFETTLTEIARDRQRLTALEEARSSRVDAPPAPPGSKTAARLEQMKVILKERGSTTFKEMERLLRISPKEMNRLLARVDKRSIEVFTRKGDRRQKVLRLRAQIR